MDIQIIGYAGPVPPTKPGVCEITVFESEAEVPPGCCAVGDVLVGDTGRSSNCDRDRVLSEVKFAACRLDADTAAVRALSDWNSSCYQVRARLLRCPASPKEGSKP